MLQYVYTRLIFQLYGRSEPTGYPRKHGSYHKTSWKPRLEGIVPTVHGRFEVAVDLRARSLNVTVPSQHGVRGWVVLYVSALRMQLQPVFHCSSLAALDPSSVV